MFEETRVKSCNAINGRIKIQSIVQNNGQNSKAEKQKVRKRLCYAICGLYSGASNGT